mgnify:CR=1 FL=1
MTPVYDRSRTHLCNKDGLLGRDDEDTSFLIMSLRPVTMAGS